MTRNHDRAASWQNSIPFAYASHPNGYSGNTARLTLALDEDGRIIAYGPHTYFTATQDMSRRFWNVYQALAAMREEHPWFDIEPVGIAHPSYFAS